VCETLGVDGMKDPVIIGNATLYNADCMELMATYPDKHFDLAIVDPPYGIEKGFQATSRVAKYGDMKSANDLKPTKGYFEELFRVSKNQIIWGYNHLSDMLPSTKEFIFWYKHQPVISYSDGELAWTSFTKTAKCFDFPFFGSTGADIQRIHPTQKPVKLYEWLLTIYAESDHKILDTHLGSMSSVIACDNLGFEITGCELSEIFFDEGIKRVKMATAQERLFA
jgi:site-specific DNA-methyltransferase (adenine-specific)